MKKIVSIILIMTVLLSIIDRYAVKADESYEKIILSEVTDVEGNNYQIEIVSSDSDGGYRINVTDLETGDKEEYTYKDGILDCYKYKKSFSLFGKCIYRRIEEKEYDFSDICDYDAMAQGYSSVTKCVWPTLKGNHVRYWIGNTGDDVGYSKIACVAKYRVKNNASYVQSMKDKIKASNRHLIESGVSVTAAVALVGILLSANWIASVAIAIISGALGCTATTAALVWKSCCEAVDAHEYFDQAKAYGKKL